VLVLVLVLVLWLTRTSKSRSFVGSFRKRVRAEVKYILRYIISTICIDKTLHLVWVIFLPKPSVVYYQYIWSRSILLSKLEDTAVICSRRLFAFHGKSGVTQCNKMTILTHSFVPLHALLF